MKEDSVFTHQGELALAGIRVIEIGTFISAPFAATLLADFGAEVLKLELPGAGDPMRTLGAYPEGGDSTYWWSSMGRNKRSVALDVRTAEGREIFGELLRDADILIENFRPGTIEGWGMTMEWMAERQPNLIVARISGYGQNGPWRNVPGFDRNAQAFAGLVYVTGEKEIAPQQCGLPVCDFSAGLWSAFGIAIALIEKLRNGSKGINVIDLALYETMIPFLKDMPQRWKHLGQITERTGNTPDYVSPGGAYQTGDDEWIFISGTGDRVFERLMTAIGRSDLAASERYKHNKQRVAYRPELDAAINQWLSERTTTEALGVLQKSDVPAVKINSISDVMSHPQVIARENFLEVDDHDRGTVIIPAPVPRMTKSSPTVRWAGQTLGEATRDVLQTYLSMTDDRMAELREKGIIAY